MEKAEGLGSPLSPLCFSLLLDRRTSVFSYTELIYPLDHHLEILENKHRDFPGFPGLVNGLRGFRGI